MAISTAPTVSEEATGSAVSSLTFNVNVPAGDNRMLLVGVALQVASGTMPTVSTVTFGAQSLAKTDGTGAAMVIGNTDDTEKARVELWWVTAPNVGANNIVVTASAACTVLYAAAHVWTGVHQGPTDSDQLGTAATAQSDTASSTTATATVDVTSATGEVVVDMVIDFFQLGGSNHTITPGSGQTAIETRSGLGRPMAGASYEAGAATVTMSWDFVISAGAVHNLAIVGVPLKPATTTSPDVSADVTIAEIGLVTWRGGPSGFSPTDAFAQNQEPSWAAMGVFPGVFSLHFEGEEPIWNQVYLVNSKAPAAKIAVTSLPCPASPNGSLLVATGNAVIQFPLPYTGEPTQTEFPDLANGGNDFLPVLVPPAVDLGNDLYQVRYVECYGDNFTQEADSWGMSFRWDNTNAWETVELQSQGYALFRIDESDANRGSVFSDAYSIYDAATDDPIGPSGRWIVVWVKKVADDPQRPYDLHEPERQDAEVS